MPESVVHALERLPPWTWVLPVVLLVAVGVNVGLRLARTVVARRSARSRRLGEAGVRRAIELLRRERFTVLATEVVREAFVEVDGRLETFTVRIDALVARRGELWVAEMKGGDDSTSVHDRATRRQLLEYAHVFGATGVLLVDGLRGRIHVVRFPVTGTPSDVTAEVVRAASRSRVGG